MDKSHHTLLVRRACPKFKKNNNKNNNNKIIIKTHNFKINKKTHIHAVNGVFGCLAKSFHCFYLLYMNRRVPDFYRRN